MKTEETLRDQLKQDGYSQEEKYFYELNRDLIDRQRIGLERIQKRPNHRCPRCDSPLKATTMSGIVVDQCAGCDGIFLG